MEDDIKEKKRPFRGLKSKIKKQLPGLIIFILLFLLIGTFFFNRIVYIIRPGEAGVFWSLFFGGTRTDYVYPEGIEFIFPWDKLYIYDVRFQEEPRELPVLSEDGLLVNLLISIRYAPQYKLLGLLHQRIGPNYLEKVVIPEIESVLRNVIGTMKAEEIYTTGRQVIKEALNYAIEQVEQRYIDVDDVLIKRTELPEKVAKAIEFQIEQKHLVKAHQFIVEKEKEEAKRKRIEGEGIRDQVKIISEALPERDYLKWRGIEATREIATSENAKVVIIGNGEKGLPIIFNADGTDKK